MGCIRVSSGVCDCCAVLKSSGVPSLWGTTRRLAQGSLPLAQRPPDLAGLRGPMLQMAPSDEPDLESIEKLIIEFKQTAWNA